MFRGSQTATGQRQQSVFDPDTSEKIVSVANLNLFNYVSIVTLSQ